MSTDKALYKKSLEFHSAEQKGKISIYLPKPLTNRYDLSLAYSPGVAAPCEEIHRDPNAVFEYTAKGNFVAVITNGTAVLGLGNLGALASKPVMEGKAALFKRFADVDAIDIEVDTEDPEKFINAVKYLGASWGGINLEDIKAPECFVIEKELEACMDIPVFHDDQHGTAIITAAGIMNAVDLTKKDMGSLKCVMNGAGAASIACADILVNIGISKKNIIMCDSRGVIYHDRAEGMNQWKRKYAAKTEHRTLEDAIEGADVFIGLSVKNALSQAMVKKMASAPIIFAMANPDPEITPNEVKEVRSDAIVATGRSDYNNQVNNVMCFPYIFRGALDVRARVVNNEMKIAAVKAIANLARQNVTTEVQLAYGDKKCEYGPEYIIPSPFDSRLIQEVSAAVAKAAVDSNVAGKKIVDYTKYKRDLAARLNPGAILTNQLFEQSLRNPRRIIFTEGEEASMIEAALKWSQSGCGEAVLIGKENIIMSELSKMGVNNIGGYLKIQIQNAAVSSRLSEYASALYQRLQRKGFTLRDCERIVKRDRNVFAACLLKYGEADGMVTGLTRDYLSNLDDIAKVIDIEYDALEGQQKDRVRPLFGLSPLIKRDKMIFVADTAIHESPSAEELAEIAIVSAEEVKNMGFQPRVAFCSYSNFGNRNSYGLQRIQKALEILKDRDVGFEYDGEMCVDVALSSRLLKLYPFCKLSATANILIMPGLHSASAAVKMLSEFGHASAIGPILCGLYSGSVQVVNMGSDSAAVFNAAMNASIRS